MKGCHHTDGIAHDCGYVDRVNALIDAAEIAAHARVTSLGRTSADRRALLARYFHEEMQRLTEAHGLRRYVRRGPVEPSELAG
jgi:hypothetical protein